MTTITREIAAAHAFACVKNKTHVAKMFNVSPRTIGRWADKVENERREVVQAKLVAKFEGKVQRRRVTVINCR